MIKEKLDKLGLGVAEIIGLGTSFLFITGVSYYYGYFVVGLKADWLINLLTTKELLISNIRLGVCLALALVFLQEVFSSESETQHKRHRAFFMGCVALIVILIFSMWKNYNSWVQTLSYLLGLIAVFGLFYFKYLGRILSILLLVFVVPFLNGLSAYQKKISSHLPVASLKDDAQQWYIFDAFSDQVILIDSVKKIENIRVVQVNELENIRVE
ncbi:hypothetical protein FM020_10370 [Acinetobacter tandoii]|nr:hypothetical protein FM020_10370 [Acinetobacter tandoii]